MTGARLDFVGIGAQKAGTTALHAVLRTHPQLYLPPSKELPFFHQEVSRDAVEAYMEANFAPARRMRAGKITPFYLHTDGTAERLARFCPATRILCMLRDPVERAFSQYRMNVHRGVERRPFEQAIEDQLEWRPHGVDPRSEPDTYLYRGEYGRMLVEWLRWFEPRQVLVLFTADFERDPSGTLDRVHRFLGVAPHRSPREGSRVHTGGAQRRIPGLTPESLHGAARRLGLRPLLRSVPEERRRQFLFWLEQWNVKREPAVGATLPPSLDHAVREHYRLDAELLAPLVGAPIPWLADPAWSAPSRC